MQLHELKSPGYVPNGAKLRMEAFKAINYAQIMRDKSPDSDTAQVLREFFLDCAAQLAPAKTTKATK
jgi:hypothetical protein